LDVPVEHRRDVQHAGPVVLFFFETDFVVFGLFVLV
jgi:hypothetical protein